MKYKKIMAILLTIAVILSSICFSLFSYANEKTVDINVRMLESILNDRNWIIESLINDDISSNPYAVINSATNNQSLMKEVLENYKNDKAFKAVVDAMEYYGNSGDYISGLGDDVIEALMKAFGLNNSGGVGASIDKISASTSELKYESILNEVLKTDYTSSWGDTLFEDNMNLENLQQKAKILKKLNKYQTTLKDYVGFNMNDSSAVIIYNATGEQMSSYDMTIQDYTGHFLDAYGADLEEYLNDVVDIPGLNGNKALKKKVLAAGALGVVSLYESTVLPDFDDDLDNLFYDGMFEDTMKIIKGGSKVLNIANKSMDYAILMEALQSQKNSTVTVMERISTNTKDEDLSKVLDNYADLANSEGDKASIAYECITNYMRNNEVVTNFVKKKVTSSAPKLMSEAALKYGGAKGFVLYNRVASNLSLATQIADLTVWVANNVTGVEDTAKKIYVLKYLDKIIKQAVSTYKADLKVYMASKTDENAEKVLDDLDFIKALRLFGEKTAYQSICSQTNSWIGALLGGDDVGKFLDSQYQAQIDTFLGCTFNPLSNKEYSLSSGDVITLMSEDVNGKSYSEAMIKKANGTYQYIAEADYRLFGGINLNGATLNIISSPNGIYIPLIDNNKESTINIYCNDVSFGTINNTSTLNINLKKDSNYSEISDLISNSGTININCDNQTIIKTYDINNSRTINSTNCQLDVNGSLTNNGTINSKVNVCGDGSQVYDNHYFSIINQAINGTGTCKELLLNSNKRDGIKFSASQTVTSYFSEGAVRLNPSNIILSGNCQIANNKLKNSVTFKNYSNPNSFVAEGPPIIEGDVTFGGETMFKEGLYISSNCKTLNLNADATVKGDLYYYGGTVKGTHSLKLAGNIDSNSSLSISNLDFVGKTPQTISNYITVDTLENHNTSLDGVTLNGTINVNKEFKTSLSSKYNNSKNIVLTGDAKITGNEFKDNISANNWNCTNDAKIKGILYATGAINIKDNSKLNVGGYNQTSGSIAIKNNSELCVDNYYQSAGSLTIDESSALYSTSDFYSAGTTNNYGVISVDGDMKVDGALSGNKVNVKGDLVGTANITLKELNFNAKLAQNYSNSSKTTVDNLNVQNYSSEGLNVGSALYVNDTYKNNDSKVVNEENIIVLSASSIPKEEFENGVRRENFTIKTNFVVERGQSLTIRGALNMLSGATLTVQEGAELTVVDCLISNGATINVAGDLVVKGDAQLSSTKISANGLITFKSDLTSSSCTWNNPNLKFASALSQKISGSEMNVNNLEINNTSNSGITLDSNVNYYGNLVKNNSKITNETKLISKN